MINLHFKKKKLIVSTAILTAFLTNGVMAAEAAAEANVAKSDQPVVEATKSINNKLAKKKALEAEAIEVIDVKGLRGSLETAQFLKRHSNAVIEVISAEDIGQFADASLTDALERVPGVQIERDDSGQSGDTISIRGLGGNYVTSTINSRMMLSSGAGGLGNLRRANYNVLPPDVFSGVKVQKTATAVGPEAGMAGAVDKQTLRPLDSRSLKNKSSLMRVGIGSSTNDLADDAGTSLKGVLAFKNEDETLGYFISAVKSKDHRGSDQVRGALTGKNYIIDADGDGRFISPVYRGNAPTAPVDPDSPDYIHERVQSQANVLLSPIREETNRTAVALGLQWRPTDDMDIMFDVAHAQFDNYSYRERGTFVLNSPWGHVWPATGLNIVGGENTNYLTGIDWNAAHEDETPYFQSGAVEVPNETVTTVGGINFIYYGDRLTTEIDLYYSGVRYDGRVTTIVADSTLSHNTTMDSSGLFPVFTGLGDAILDYSTYEFVSAKVSQNKTGGDHYGAAIDFNYAIGGDYIDSIDFGARYHTTSMDVLRSGDDFHDSKPGGPLTIIVEDKNSTHIGTPWQDVTKEDMTAAILSGQPTDNNIVDGKSGFTEWLAIDGKGCELIPTICSATLENGELAESLRNSFTMEESVLAAYVQLNLDGELAGLPFSGNIGIRAVETTDIGTAWKYETIGSFDETFVPVETEGSYWTYLPTLNLRGLPTEDTAIRLALGKTMSRAQLQHMAPNIDLKYDESKIDNPSYYPQARLGNPDLKPMTAISYDLTLEWYNSHRGAYIFSMYYKDISNYILQQSTIRPLLEFPEGDLWRVRQAVNFSEANVKGFELGFYQPFTFLDGFWSSFGARGNYTFVDSEIKPSTSFDVADGTDPTNAGFGFPGVSKNNVNLSIFYQKKPLTVRLTYVYRDDYFRSISVPSCQPNCETYQPPSIKRFTEGNGTFSINANYVWNANLRFSAAITNLTDNYRRDYSDEPSHFLDYYSRGRGYRVSMAYTF